MKSGKGHVPIHPFLSISAKTLLTPTGLFPGFSCQSALRFFIWKQFACLVVSGSGNFPAFPVHAHGEMVYPLESARAVNVCGMFAGRLPDKWRDSASGRLFTGLRRIY